MGYDLYSCILTDKRAPSVMYVPPRHTIRIPTGLCVATDPGYYLQVHSRSGLACGIPPMFVANGPGIIDPDYRGPVHVILYNGGEKVYAVRHHERVGQLIIAPVLVGEVCKRPGMKEEVTNRGHRGYGSSGMKEIIR